MNRKRVMVAAILLLVATMSWGGMFPVAKNVLSVMDAYYMTLLRYGFAALLFVAILLVSEGKQALSFEGRTWTLLALGTLGFAGFNLLAFNALVHSKPEHGAVVMALMPLITVLLSWLLKGERPQTFTFAMIALAFFGVFMVITRGHPSIAFGGGAAYWDLLFLLGALCWVAYTMGAQLFPTWSPLRYTTLSCVLGTLSIAVITLGLTMSGSIQAPSLGDLAQVPLSLVYLVIMGGLIAVLSWNTGIRTLGAINGVLFINFVPVTAFTVGIFAGHAISSAELLGALCVIVALVANNLYLRKARGPQPERAAMVDSQCESA